MSTPSKRPIDPNDLTAYAPKWARTVSEEARRRMAPAVNDDRTIVEFHDAVDALRAVDLQECIEDVPPHDRRYGERGGCYIDNFRVPPSLDPSLAHDHIVRRQPRDWKLKTAILADKKIVVAGVAVLAAFLLVGKFALQTTAEDELPHFQQFASFGPVAPVIPEAASRPPAPVLAPPIGQSGAQSLTMPPMSLQEPSPSAAVPPASTASTGLKKETAIRPAQSTEPIIRPTSRSQIVTHSPTKAASKSGPVRKKAGEGNRNSVTTATPQASSTPSSTLKSGPSVKQPPGPKLDRVELAFLMKRSEEFIGAGDFASARIILRRVAESGHAGAALTLAGTYDPAVLERFGVAGMAADPPQAKFWYEKAREMGSAEATRLLERLAIRQY